MVATNFPYEIEVGAWRSCLVVVWHVENTGFYFSHVLIKDLWGCVTDRKKSGKP